MAYENTEVPVSRSQEKVKELIRKHGGFGTAFVSELDPQGRDGALEGFHAKVMINGKPYAIRVMARVKAAPRHLSDPQRGMFTTQQERRIWRVLYYHMKSVYEASDSGVMEFRELMLPYLVMNSGQTVAEAILPRIDAALAMKPERLLSVGEP